MLPTGMGASGREGWRLPWGGEIPDDMRFRQDPPSSIGVVTVAWSNSGPKGPKPRPVSEALLDVGLGALGGFVVGLVAFFAIGGYLESQGTRIEADYFLLALALGAVLGAAASGTRVALRPKVEVSFFVGRDGAAIVRRGSVVTEEIVLFADLDEITTRVSVTQAQGIRVAAREVRLKRRGESAKLWMVSRVPGEAEPHDEQFWFLESVLAAFATHVEARRLDP